MILLLLVIGSASLVKAKNISHACPKLAVGTYNGGSLLWQLLVQGYYLLDNICGDAWSLLECRADSILDSASCFWSALEVLRTRIAAYRPFIADYKKQVYNFGVDFSENWGCCIGLDSCEDDEGTEPKFIDTSKFYKFKDDEKIRKPGFSASASPEEKSSPTRVFDPTPLPTIPPVTESPNPKPQNLGVITIRGKIFGVDFLLFEIDLTNMFY